MYADSAAGNREDSVAPLGLIGQMRLSRSRGPTRGRGLDSRVSCGCTERLDSIRYVGGG